MAERKLSAEADSIELANAKREIDLQFYKRTKRNEIKAAEMYTLRYQISEVRSLLELTGKTDTRISKDVHLQAEAKLSQLLTKLKP